MDSFMEIGTVVHVNNETVFVIFLGLWNYASENSSLMQVLIVGCSKYCVT